MAEKRCPFCSIAAAPPGTDEVLREENLVTILDHRPLVEGHCLVFPARHVATVMDLEEREVAPLFAAARRLARAMEKGLDADGALILMNNRVSQSVPHLHIHVVPRRFKDGLFAKPFFWARRKYPSKEASAQVAARLRGALTID